MRVFLPDDSSPKIPLKQEDDFSWIESSIEDEISPASLWSIDEQVEASADEEVEPPSDFTTPPTTSTTEGSFARITKREIQDDNHVWNDHAPRSPWWSEDLLAESEEPSVEQPTSVNLDLPEEEGGQLSNEQCFDPADDDDEVTVVTARSFEDDHNRAEEAPAKQDQINLVPQNEPEEKAPRILDESAVLPHEASYATVSLYQEVEEDPEPNEHVLDDSTVLPHEASFATVPLFRDQYRKHSALNEFLNKFAFSAKRVLPVLLVVLFGAALVVLGIKALSNLNQQDQRLEAAMPTETPVDTRSENSVAAPIEPTPLPEPPPSEVLTEEKKISQPVAEIAVKEAELVEVSAKPKASRSRQAETVTSKKRNARLEAAAERTVKKRDATPKQTVAKQPTPREAKAEGKVEAKVESRPVPAQPKQETPRKPQPTGGGERPRRVNPDGS